MWSTIAIFSLVVLLIVLQYVLSDFLVPALGGFLLRRCGLSRLTRNQWWWLKILGLVVFWTIPLILVPLYVIYG